MLIQEALLAVLQTPLGYYASAAAHHACQAVVGQMHVFQPYATVYREVVHALLALLHECVAKHLPVQVLHLAAGFFKSLIHGHGAHRHRTVAQYPLASFVYL